MILRKTLAEGPRATQRLHSHLVMTVFCKLCNSPQRGEIEKKLVTGGITQREAAKLIGAHHSSIQRHMRNHLQPSIRQLKEEIILSEHSNTAKSGLDVARQLELSHDKCVELFQEALRRGSIRDALRALEVEIKQLQLSAKIQGVCSDTPQINLLMQPEFIRLKQVVVENLAEHPEKLPLISAKFDEIVEGYGKDDKPELE